MRIGLIASPSQTVDQPFAGGMEAHTVSLARSLRRGGHEVVIHAGGTDEEIQFSSQSLRLSGAAVADVSMPPERFMAEHHAYLSLMLELDEHGYDIVHNNCLHYLPVAMAATLRTPMVTTLHSPPTPWLESAIQSRRRHRGSSWVSVSHANAGAWSHLCGDCPVIHNGVDLDRWAFRPQAGDGSAVWSGRIVPEKGTHLAIEAAAIAGVRLAIAGPATDPEYFERCMADAGPEVTYHGHLDDEHLADLVGAASVCLVTPCWEEPFGLVAIEALSCGTPVAAFERGAIPEVLDAETGALAAPDDAADLARKLVEAVALDRAACRRRAAEHFSLQRMTARYLRVYEAAA